MIADYLIVGAGLTGATLARELTDAGKRVIVIDKREHIGGQCYTETRDGQVMNLYGGHIFHANDLRLWEYVNRFGAWRQYSHHVKAISGECVYSFPPNRMTWQQLGAEDEHAIREKFFVGYTEKMWGRPYAQVPASVTRRIPMRDTWIDEYFSDRFQGLPEGGYTPMFARMLGGIDVRLGVDYLTDRWLLDRLAAQTIYTGPIDALFDHDGGRLEWRGMRFEHWRVERETYQGCATMNYCDADVPWLRDEEWKFFWKPERPMPYSWVTRSYPSEAEQYYPVPDDANRRLAGAYRDRATSAGYIVAGRLATYQYLDMHQAIGAALAIAEKIKHGTLDTISAD